MSTKITLLNVDKLFSENNTKKYLPVDDFLKKISCTEKKDKLTILNIITEKININGEDFIAVKRTKLKGLFKGIPVINPTNTNNLGYFTPCKLLLFLSREDFYLTNKYDDKLQKGFYLIKKGLNEPFVFVYNNEDKIYRYGINFTYFAENKDLDVIKWHTNPDILFNDIDDLINHLIKTYCPNCKPYINKSIKYKYKTCPNCKSFTDKTGGYLNKYLKYKHKYLALKYS